MKNILRILLAVTLVLTVIETIDSGWAKYKAREWKPRLRESYSASLTSEKVTIAVEPFFTDALAAQVFDKTDMITRGIMPLAVIIFNDNEFAVEVDGLSMELLHKNQRLQTMPPNEVVYRLFKKDRTWNNAPVPRISMMDLNEDALEDFDKKFLMKKNVAAHDSESGFLFLHIPDSEDIVAYLSQSLLYIPKIYRKDNGSRMIYFEIEIAPAVKTAGR